MKKIWIGLLCVLVFSLTIFNIKSEEFFEKISGIRQAEPAAETVTGKQSEKAGQQVRIILKRNNDTSMYHAQVSLKSGNLTVYYGKKNQTKKSCKKITIEKNDKMFRKNDVIRVEGKGGILWEKDDGETMSYQGMFYIYHTSSGLVIVNEVDMEQYVAGVISSEIGSGSPVEALKAQAVCARTFIVKSQPEEYAKYDANGDDSVSYQVYNKTAPDPECLKAAEATKNQVMLYKDSPITAYYFSTSCGYTTDGRIWGKKKLNYLKGCCTLKKEREEDITEEENFKSFITSNPKAYESKYPYYRWNVYLTNEQVQNAVSRTAGVNTGYIRKIEVNDRGTGGIASQITIYGKNRQLIMTNQNQIRKALCSYYSEISLNDGSTRTKMEMLPSAFIFIESVYQEGTVCGFKIYGGGYGHGSGMSQNGATEMAKAGMTYDEILKKFYHNITIGNHPFSEKSQDSKKY